LVRFRHAAAVTRALRPAAAVLAAAAIAAGCQQVGPRASIDRARTDLESPSPVTLQIEDDAKKGVASGVGPARYTSITADEIQTIQSGTTPRDLWVQTHDGTKVNLSSGSDIIAEGLEYDPATGLVKIRRFSTSASEPIRAGNEALDRLVAWWAALSADQREARLAELRAAENIAPDVRDLIVGLLAGL